MTLLSDYFKPEERKRGEDLFQKDVVLISSASDTEVRAFVQASGKPRVSLSADDVTSESFRAQCSCPAAGKGTLCKHVWATLLKLEDKGSDFLESKSAVEVSQAPINSAKVELKERQRSFQKQRYEKQKTRAKEMRREKKGEAAPQFEYPPEVEDARTYFRDNGFDLVHPLDIEALNSARKILSRVFHPDKGGTHAETLTLNQNYDLIRNYLKVPGSFFLTIVQHLAFNPQQAFTLFH